MPEIDNAEGVASATEQAEKRTEDLGLPAVSAPPAQVHPHTRSAQ